MYTETEKFIVYMNAEKDSSEPRARYVSTDTEADSIRVHAIADSSEPEAR